MKMINSCADSEDTAKGIKRDMAALREEKPTENCRWNQPMKWKGGRL